jgi:signal peptidase I
MRTFIVCTILVVCFLVSGCKGVIFNAPTENMLPTIKVGEYFFVNHYSSVETKRFDIVIFKAPLDITKSTKILFRELLDFQTKDWKLRTTKYLSILFY